MPLISISELAALTAKKRSTVSAVLAEIQHTTGKRNAKMYESADALTLLYKPPEGEVMDLSAARAGLALEQTRTALLKNDVTEGELIPASVVTETLAKLAARINAILGTIPGKVGRISSISKRELELVQIEIVRAQNCCADLGEVDDKAS